MQCEKCRRSWQWDLQREDRRGKDLGWHDCWVLVCMCGYEMVIAVDGKVILER